MQLFFSDLHLSPTRPKQVNLFLKCLEKAGKEANSVFILGDLFDFWVGDDDYRYPSAEVKQALRLLTSTGTHLFLSVGNRDFLLGDKFAEETRAVLLPDYEMIDLGGERTLITHGDLLCTKDRTYQRFRKVVRNKFIQKLFLSLPLSLRVNIASKTQNETLKSTKKKPMEIMDVEPDQVNRLLTRHKSTLLIHGHTHRPAIHAIEIEGKKHRRVVLGDWCDPNPYLFICQLDDQRLIRANDYLGNFLN